VISPLLKRITKAYQGRYIPSYDFSISACMYGLYSSFATLFLIHLSELRLFVAANLIDLLRRSVLIALGWKRQ
jgi:hypothetical protein